MAEGPDKSVTRRTVGAAGRGAVAVGRSASSAVQGAHSQLEVLPQASEQWGSYWTFVTATITVMFVLYLAQKGRLQVWLQFFMWSNPSTPTVTGTTAAATAAGNPSTVAPTSPFTNAWNYITGQTSTLTNTGAATGTGN